MLLAYGALMSTFDAVELIRTKRDGGRLTDPAIDWLIRNYTDGVVSDEQMSAMAMAIFFQGLDGAELSRWTNAMIATGERMDFSSLSRPTVDKHSTGGVGDTWVAAVHDHQADELVESGGGQLPGEFSSESVAHQQCPFDVERIENADHGLGGQAWIGTDDHRAQ